MVAQLSLLTALGITSITSSSASSSTSLSAASSSILASSASASSTISASFAQLTAAPSVGTPSNSANSTSTITSKPQTTVSLFNACSGSDEQCQSLNDLTYFGSVITADKTMTIYALGCAQNGKNATSECFTQPLTVTQGPSAFVRVDGSGAVPTTVSCDIKSVTESAVCTEKYKLASGAAASATASASASANLSSGNSSTASTVFNFDDSMIYYNKLVITQGAEKMNGNSSIATKTPSAPSTPSASPTTKKSAAGSLSAPVASLAGIAALLFVVMAI